MNTADAPIAATSPMPVAPLEYAAPAQAAQLTPLVRTIAWVLIIWSGMDLVHYMMALRSTLAYGSDGTYEFLLLYYAFGAASNFLLLLGAWHALYRRRSARRILIVAQLTWIVVLLIHAYNAVGGWRDWLTTPVPPNTPWSAQPIYWLTSSMLETFSPFVVTIGSIFVLRLPVLREYFNETKTSPHSLPL